FTILTSAFPLHRQVRPALLSFLLLTSCTKPAMQAEISTEPNADLAFAQLSHEFIESYLKINPVSATSLGDHRYDAFWPDISREAEAKDRARFEVFQKSLTKIEISQLNADNQVDAAILNRELSASFFTMDSLKPLENSAMSYIGILSAGLDGIISHSYSTPEARAETLIQRLNHLHFVTDVARTRLGRPPRLDTETAISQIQGLIELCQTGLKDLQEKAPEAASGLHAAGQEAAQALQQFKTFLEMDLLPRSDGDFRLGKKLYAQKMQFDLGDSIEAEQLAQSARLALDKTLEDMYQVAARLSPQVLGKAALPTKNPSQKRKLVRAVLNGIAKEQPNDTSFFHDAQQAIDSATLFIKQKNILSIPEEHCQVIEMPAFNQGVAGAYSQSSGPFESKFENFVALQRPDAAERSSFYREYNRSMLTELMLHEAMPGHCLQAMHAVRNKNLLRGIFGNGPYIEGWAMYSEQVMAQHGFGGDRVKLSQLKLLARAISNTLLDYGVHTQGMSESEAMRLMMDETYQEKAEAVGKWRRVRLSSVQLTTYFYGYQQFVAMRKAAEKRPDFNELAFHDQLLGSGAPPLKLLRARWGI
ncbi:MAG: DUF885 domain-containing protein, partial [Proteobacteria bacterium]|nr:DUF885 domain-containing protein [Pseudomonadota bacterium]